MENFLKLFYSFYVSTTVPSPSPSPAPTPPPQFMKEFYLISLVANIKELLIFSPIVYYKIWTL